MRQDNLLFVAFLALFPFVFAQWGGHNWNRPSRTWGYPQQYGPPTTLATIATPPPQVPYQTENGAPIQSYQTGGEGPQQSPQTGGGLPQTYQTGGGGGGNPTGVNQPTIHPGGPTGGGVPSATGSPPPSQSGTSSSTNGTSDNTPAKGVIYKYPDTSSEAVSLAPAWACNWDSTPGISNPPFQYVPQMWGPGHTLSDLSSSEYVLFYNEPDECQSDAGGSCVPLSQTINDFKTTFLSATSGKKVSTPCVTNGGASFLEAFLEGVTTSTVDILCFHWYGGDPGSLQSAVQTFKQLQQKYSIPEIWISEMGVTSNPTDVSQYTQYLDGTVDRYAYNLYNLGAGGTL